ncbi:MAG TPA: SDR family NAD(P)-dependent oxidoreductase [Candidatus Ligilactobacillus excrementavium]|nr:SDR family NAD(P)-dependent oxidoreductase [Candidatus Ligilactobacillus excrementavium]
MNKFVVITGASSGIGRKVAIKFAKRGKNIVLAARSKDILEQLKDELEEDYGVQVETRVVDLTDMTVVKKFYESLQDLEVETLINDAGFGLRGALWENQATQLLAMIDLNIKAVTYLSQLFLSDHQNIPNTQLINVSSLGGYQIVNDMVAYCASKFYVSAFTEGLANELQERGALLKAKVLAPAVTKTNFDTVARNTKDFNYDTTFKKYHTAEQMAGFLMQLYDSEQTVGVVNEDTMDFELKPAQFKAVGFK